VAQAAIVIVHGDRDGAVGTRRAVLATAGDLAAPEAVLVEVLPHVGHDVGGRQPRAVVGEQGPDDLVAQVAGDHLHPSIDARQAPVGVEDGHPVAGDLEETGADPQGVLVAQVVGDVADPAVPHHVAARLDAGSGVGQQPGGLARRQHHPESLVPRLRRPGGLVESHAHAVAVVGMDQLLQGGDVRIVPVGLAFQKGYDPRAGVGHRAGAVGLLAKLEQDSGGLVRQILHQPGQCPVPIEGAGQQEYEKRHQQRG
jgi:hypothetical protein